MDKKNYRSYPEAFKLEALGLLQKGEKSAGQIERELGITPGLLVKWRAHYQAVRKGRQAVRLEPSDLESAKAEIKRLRRELAEMEEERDILKKSRQHLLTEKPMIYQFMAEHEREFQIQRMRRVLGVGRSGYYAWRSRPASQRTKVDEALLVKIQQEYRISRGTYGSPRIHAALQKQGVKCSQKRVARLIRLHKITGQKRQKRRPVTTQHAPGAIPAPNLLNQEFYAPAPNQKWVSDITYIETAEGWLYLASILDLFSRRVVA